MEIVRIIGREILGLPRQPHGRGRRLPGGWQHGPRRRAVRRIDRRARSRRASRRRQEALPRQGRHESGRERPRRDRARRSPGMDASTRPPSIGNDRARRHAEQGQARRQRDPRRLDGRARARQPLAADCRCTGISAASQANLLPVPMMNILNGGAHADNPSTCRSS